MHLSTMNKNSSKSGPICSEKIKREEKSRSTDTKQFYGRYQYMFS